MELQHEINFNDPLELREIFRTQEGQEYGILTAIGWEDIKAIEEYPYTDNWKLHPGEKFHLTLQGGGAKLILGSFDSMLRHWKVFRNKYPIFVEMKDEGQDSPE